MKLNNKTVNGLTASIKIFNKTENDWVKNYVLLEQIQEDLDTLPSKVEGLKQATMYDYNDRYLPGCVYVLLSPTDLSLSREVSNHTIDYIKNNTAKWWYIADVTFETLDLTIFGPPLKYLMIYYILITTVPKAQDAFNPVYYRFPNGTYDLNPYAYSIINNTVVPHYLQRDNIRASLFLYNGTQWVLNEPFLAYLNQTFKTLNDQYLFKRYNTTLGIYYDNLEKTLEFYHEMRWNTNPKINENSTKDDIVHVIELGTVFPIPFTYADFDCPNASSFVANTHYELFPEVFGDSWDEVLMIYITTYVLLSHYWFCTAEGTEYIASSGDQAGSSFDLLFSLGTLFILATAVISAKRRFKHQLV